MIRCSECKTVDVEFEPFHDNEVSYMLCPECGANDSEEEIDSDLWAEEMAEDDADRLNDYLAIEGDNEEL